MIYLHKILPLIFSPLMLIIVLIIFGVIINSKKISLSGVFILIVCSSPIVSDRLVAYLESDYQLSKPSNITSADAIVVLSGMIRTIKHNNGIYYEFSDAVDRVFAGIELLKLNKAQKIILTRGKLPWSLGMPEGEFLAQFVKSQGVSKNQIILTEAVQNTNDEAIAVSKILPENSTIILVTSAFHMQRAERVFENQNLKVIPYAVDFRSVEKKIDVLDFLPQANAFKDSSFYFREIIGRTYYSLRY